MMRTRAVLLVPFVAIFAAASAGAADPNSASAAAGANGGAAGSGAAAGTGSSPDCANGPESLNPKQCPGADARARQLAQEMADNAKLDFGDDAAAAAQSRQRFVDYLTGFIENDPRHAALLEQALKQGKTTYPGPDGKDVDLKQLLQNAVAGPNGAAEMDATHLQGNLADAANKLSAKYSINEADAWKELQARFDNDYASGSVPAPPSVAPVPGAGGLAGQRPLVLGGEEIAGMPVEDIYQNGNTNFAGPDHQQLYLSAHNDPDDPYGMYVNLSDVTNVNNVRGQTVAVAPGVTQLVVLNGQAYLVGIAAAKEDDHNGGTRDDFKVTVRSLSKEDADSLQGKLAKGEAMDKALDKIAPSGKKGKDVGTELATQDEYGAQGLLAQRVNKVYEDAHGPDASMHTVTLDGRRYYVTIQGGSTVSYVYFLADDIDAAHDAIQQAKNGAGSDPSKLEFLQPGMLMPSFVVPFAQSNKSGIAVPMAKGDQPPIFTGVAGELPAYRYVFDAGARAMVLTQMTQDDLDSYCTAHTGANGCAASGAGAGSGPGSGALAGGAPGGVGAGPVDGPGGPDKDWPDEIRSDDMASCLKTKGANADIDQVRKTCTYALRQSGVNAALKGVGADYRLYTSSGSYFIVTPNPGRDAQGYSRVVIPKDTMTGNQVKAPAAPDASASVARRNGYSYLVISSKAKGFAYYFDIANPKIAVGYADKTQKDEPLDVNRRAALVNILLAAGFNDGDAQAIDAKASQALSNGAFGEIKESSGELDLYFAGNDTNSTKLWPEGDAKLPADNGGEAAKPSGGAHHKGSGAGSGSGSSSPSLYAMNDTKAAPSSSILPGQGTVFLRDGSKITVLKALDGEFPAGVDKPYGAWYRDHDATQWYLGIVVYAPKPGVALKDAKESDLVSLGTVFPGGARSPEGMHFNRLVVRDAADANRLHITNDVKHPGALAAYLDGPDATGKKYGAFIQHVAWVGDKEPNPAEDGPSAYPGDVSAPAPSTSWYRHPIDSFMNWWHGSSSQTAAAQPLRQGPWLWNAQAHRWDYAPLQPPAPGAPAPKSPPPPLAAAPAPTPSPSN